MYGNFADFFSTEGALKYELNYFHSVQTTVMSILLLRVKLEVILNQHSLLFPPPVLYSRAYACIFHMILPYFPSMTFCSV